MVDPLSVAGIAISVLQVAVSLVQRYSNYKRIPKKVKRLETCLEDFKDDVTVFEEVLREQGQPLIGTKSLKQTLENSSRLLQKYLDKFKNPTFLRIGYEALKPTDKDEHLFESLVREIDVSIIKVQRAAMYYTLYRLIVKHILPRTFTSFIHCTIAKRFTFP